MKTRKPSSGSARGLPPFNAQTFLESSGIEKAIVEYARGATIFTQGDPCEDVLYIQSGGVKLSVLSKTGREAVVAMLGPGDFFGEGCLGRSASADGQRHGSHAECDPARRQGKDGTAAAQDKPSRVVPKVWQATLADMVGTTRSRVNFFLNKFKRLGFIEYNGENPLKINSSLLSVVLHD